MTNHLGSRPWVRLLVYLLQAFGGHVGVDLGGLQVRVSEHFLNAPKVGTAVEEVCCEAVP